MATHFAATKLMRKMVESDVVRGDETKVSNSDFVWRIAKALILIITLLLCYTALLQSWMTPAIAIPLVAAISLLTYSIAVCVGHDAVHGAFSGSKRLNNIALLVLDFVGVNGIAWRTRHLLHHWETNNVHTDPDIQSMPWIRLTDNDRPLIHHRFQAVFAPVLYCLTLFKMQFFDEARIIHRADAPERWRLIARSVLSKLVFIGWSLVLPSLVVGFENAWPFFLMGYCSLSFLLSFIFQVAHNVPGVTHLASETPNSGSSNWKRCQIAATANFRAGKLWGFFVGGLDRQIEHHLFPNIPHTRLPHFEFKTRDICSELGEDYKISPSLIHAFFSHLRYLQHMSR